MGPIVRVHLPNGVHVVVPRGAVAPLPVVFLEGGGGEKSHDTPLRSHDLSQYTSLEKLPRSYAFTEVTFKSCAFMYTSSRTSIRSHANHMPHSSKKIIRSMPLPWTTQMSGVTC